MVSWNLYLGWYVPGFILNDLWMGFFHLCFPNRPFGYKMCIRDSLCSIQYYLRFWLGICRTSLAVSALRIMRYCQ